MSKRDDIAKVLASRWDQMPAPSIPVEDRRPTDPLQAYVTPQPLAFEGSFPATGWADIVEPTNSNDGTMRYPGPMPLDMSADIDRFAAGEAKIPQPELFGGPSDPRWDDRAKMDQTLRLMQVFEPDPTVSGHLGYLDAPPAGSKMYRGDPPKPYVPQKYEIPQPTGGLPEGMTEEDTNAIDEIIRQQTGGSR